ncbi:large T antigen [Tadarida brasiliensis polyomavirus 1]|uniref:large T antigen n=1 Tax=Tadarida brasiliensis polyomavirus 1 TaxID=1588048 RepID=UPI000572A403|nr:large T antigen [Tadarida brasiliensis polyomavirus 1]AJA41151.1 large T antigen [Tadarida brasiliensis polyomavirus 1]
MDSLLEKHEREKLLQLLNLSPNCFSNFPIMKQAYKKASKRLHPDKGGNNEQMMLLNSLWHRYQEGLIDLRSSQGFSDAYGTPSFRARYAAWASTGVFTHERFRGDPDLYCDESTESSGESADEGPSQRSSEGYHSFPQCSTPNGTPEPSSSSASQAESASTFSESQHPPTPDPNRSRRAEDVTPEKRGRAPEDLDGSHPSSQASFASTPPKTETKMPDSPSDLPTCLYDFVSHAVFSNKTVNSFIIYSTLEKAALLYEKVDKLKIEFKSLHELEEAGGSGGFLVLITNSKHRLSAVKNFCTNFCTVSFLICKILLKPLDCHRFMQKPPFKEIKSNKILLSTDFDDSKEEGCNWNKVAEFAVEADIDDPLLILAHYLDFACVPPCIKCLKIKTKAHEFHAAHYNNALLFEKCKNQRSICNQASDIVLAKRRLLLAESTREELLTFAFRKQLEILKKIDEMDIINYMAGVAWYACLFEQTDELLFNILKLLTENIPKQRNILFRGPVNSGKTTLAAALMDLVGGKSLNVNCPSDKLPFELGCAIDRFAVVFEDVKGQTMLNKKLQPGQGICNLDNLRDYLDGAVPVNLEKKHVNKRSQIFPPCIVTMNEYLLPETLYVRFHMKLNFIPKSNLQQSLEKAPFLLSQRILQRGLTLFLMLLWYFPSSKFSACLKEDVANWKAIIEKTVTHEMFCKMLENVEVGESPVNNILEEELEPGNQ